jgi:hypothetical protein
MKNNLTDSRFGLLHVTSINSDFMRSHFFDKIDFITLFYEESSKIFGAFFFL